MKYMSIQKKNTEQQYILYGNKIKNSCRCVVHGGQNVSSNHGEETELYQGLANKIIETSNISDHFRLLQSTVMPFSQTDRVVL